MIISSISFLFIVEYQQRGNLGPDSGQRHGTEIATVETPVRIAGKYPNLPWGHLIVTIGPWLQPGCRKGIAYLLAIDRNGLA
jgi:hypothetical protein